MKDEKIVFDFSNRDITLKAMSKYFSISKDSIEAYLKNSPVREMDFIRTFNINLMEPDTNKAFIKNTHIATLFDGYDDLIKYGFIDLQKVLTYETNLNKFLKDNNIYFDINNERIVIDGRDYKLESNSKYKSFMLHLKIHERNGEREAFITGTNYNYSNVKNYPEILGNIEEFCNDIGINKNLLEKWEKIHKGKYYVLEFNVNVNDIKWVYDDYFCDYEYLYELGYFDEQSIPEKYKKNRYILSNCIHVIQKNVSIGKGSIIDNKAVIKFEDIKIDKYMM